MNWATPGQKRSGDSIKEKEERGFRRRDIEAKQSKHLIGYSYIVALFVLSCWKVPSYIIISLLSVSDWLDLSSAFIYKK